MPGIGSEVLDLLPNETKGLVVEALPGAGAIPPAMQRALKGRHDLDLALLPGESVNDDGLFIDGMSAEVLAATESAPETVVVR